MSCLYSKFVKTVLAVERFESFPPNIRLTTSATFGVISQIIPSKTLNCSGAKTDVICLLLRI